jgi:hypothetical protein
LRNSRLDFGMILPLIAGDGEFEESELRHKFYQD